MRGNGIGLFFKTGGQLIRIERNAITGNGGGVLIWTADIDLGGGPAGSTGNNLLAWNSDADLIVMEPVAVSATNNTWNHVPPTVYAEQNSSAKPDGVDIWRVWGNGTVKTSGAKLALTLHAVPSIPISLNP